MELNQSLKSRIESLIDSDRVVLFMKGTRVQPQCGFSAATIGILDSLVPEYTTFNVLGILLLYVIPLARNLPVFGAERLADLAVERRTLALAYVAGMFIVVPLLGIAILG